MRFTCIQENYQENYYNYYCFYVVEKTITIYKN